MKPYDPRTVETQEAFTQALVAMRVYSGLTLKGLAKLTGIPLSTLGGYMRGGLVGNGNVDRLSDIVRACGGDEEEVDAWQEALARVRLGRMPPRSEPPKPIVSLRPPLEQLPETRVEGRSELVRQLRAAGPGVDVLHAMGGAGKTTVALLVAKAESRRQVWWVSAQDRGRLTAGLETLAARVGVPPHDLVMGSLPDLLWEALERRGDRWLLVVDGADDPEDVLVISPGPIVGGAGLIRRPSHGTVLLTSRVGGQGFWGRGVRLHPVESLSPDEGGRVLTGIAGPEAGDHASTERLALRLGGLPLSLKMAAGHIAAAMRVPPPMRSPEEVLTFDAYRQAIGAGPAAGELDRAVGMSVALLARRGLPSAGNLLRLLVCFGPEPIPYSSVLHPPTLSAAGLFGEAGGVEVMNMLEGLADVNLASVGPETITVHQALRDLLRQALSSKERSTYALLVAALVDRATEHLDTSDPEAWNGWGAVGVHCVAPVEMAADVRAEDQPRLFAAALRAARYLRSAGRLVAAERVYATLGRTATALLGSGHELVLDLRHDNARLLFALGHHARAEEEFRSVWETRLTTLGPTAAPTLLSRHYLGRVVQESGRRQDAERIFTEVLEVRARVLGRSHKDTLTSMNNLADCMRERRALAEAADLLRRVYDERAALLGPEHPATLVTLHHQANVVRDNGDLPEAERRLARLHVVAMRVLGEDHPRTLRIGHGLGEIRLRLGWTAEARRLLADVQARRTELLGSGHPATRATARLLAAGHG